MFNRDKGLQLQIRRLSLSFFPNNFITACLWDVTNFCSLLLGLVLPKNFLKTFLTGHRFWRFAITKTFHCKNHYCSLISKVGSGISLRNSMNAYFVFLSFLSNKFSKNLSNFLLISTELSISFISLFNSALHILCFL